LFLQKNSFFEHPQLYCRRISCPRFQVTRPFQQESAQAMLPRQNKVALEGGIPLQARAQHQGRVFLIRGIAISKNYGLYLFRKIHCE